MSTLDAPGSSDVDGSVVPHAADTATTATTASRNVDLRIITSTAITTPILDTTSAPDNRIVNPYLTGDPEPKVLARTTDEIGRDLRLWIAGEDDSKIGALADHAEDWMIKFAGLLPFMLVPLVACGASTSETGPTTALSTCQPATMTFRAGSDGPHGVTAELPDGDEALASAIADMFCSPEWTFVEPDGTERTATSRTVLPADDAVCIGDQIVEVLGADRSKELWFGVGPWHLLGFALSNNAYELQIERPEAESIVDVFVECSDQWKLLLTLSVTEGADKISDNSADCVADLLTDDDARLILIGEIDRAYDDPSQPDAQPFPELLEPLLAAYDECLSPTEFRQVKF